MCAVIDGVDSATEKTAQVKTLEFIRDMINKINQAREAFEKQNDRKSSSFIVS